jgi:hypothetical protein
LSNKNRLRLNNSVLYYSTSRVESKNSNNVFDPYFISGIVDGEGSFVCIVRKSNGHRLG